MHEVKARLLVKHVAVQGRHLDAIVAQRPDHRIDLVRRQHKIAGNGGFAVAGRLKADSGRQAQGRAGASVIAFSVTASRRTTAN